jgi:hypothetical protein
MIVPELLNIVAQVANPFPEVGANQGTLTTILNIVFGVVGGLSLLFVVIGGFRYIISSGDPQNTVRARNTIIYAVVGLVVTLIAAGIVNFVVGRL